MAFFPRCAEKRRTLQEYREEIIESLVRPIREESPKVEQEKRVRREIANSNERRRMQSINAGFESLKKIIPHQDGEKLSKAAILQQTTDYISSLQQDKIHLESQNSHLKQLLQEVSQRSMDEDGDSPRPKRKKRDTECSDEGIGMTMEGTDDSILEEMKKEIGELRCQLEQERQVRHLLEDQNRALETQIYPERLRLLANQVQQQVQVCYQAEKRRLEAKQRQFQEVSAKDEITLSQKPKSSFIHNSMSRRNLETIVEAIRHLEGEAELHGDVEAMSEESEKEDSCSHDFPISTNSMRNVHVLNSDKYPIAMQLLHRPLHRPTAIIQKSS